MRKVVTWKLEGVAPLNGREAEELRAIIDGLGQLSALSQRLRSPLTYFDRILHGSHVLYLATQAKPGNHHIILAEGLLKVGKCNLFHRKENGQLVGISPLSVLDFYIHESFQRMGLGHQLFEAMLHHTKKKAYQLGYDRPSGRLLNFLAKHYKLTRFERQPNNYVVFNEYFEEEEKAIIKQKAEKKLKEQGLNHNQTASTIADDTFRKKKVLYGRRATQLQPTGKTQFLDNQLKTVDAKLFMKTPLNAMNQPSETHYTESIGPIYNSRTDLANAKESSRLRKRFMAHTEQSPSAKPKCVMEVTPVLLPGSDMYCRLTGKKHLNYNRLD